MHASLAYSGPTHVFGEERARCRPGTVLCILRINIRDPLFATIMTILRAHLQTNTDLNRLDIFNLSPPSAVIPPKELGSVLWLYHSSSGRFGGRHSSFERLVELLVAVSALLTRKPGIKPQCDATRRLEMHEVNKIASGLRRRYRVALPPSLRSLIFVCSSGAECTWSYHHYHLRSTQRCSE